MNRQERTSAQTVKSPSRTRVLVAYGIVFAGLAVIAGVFLPKPAVLGMLHALTGARTTRAAEENAGAEVSTEERKEEGTDSFTDLIEEQKVSREFLRTLAERRKEVAAREREAARREAALREVQADVEAKLARLEQMQKDLTAREERLNRQIDQKEAAALESSVRVYGDMDDAEVARIFYSMDMKYVVKILKQETMPADKVGAVISAMLQEAEKETDPEVKQEKMQALKELNEMLVDPVKASR